MNKQIAFILSAVIVMVGLSGCDKFSKHTEDYDEAPSGVDQEEITKLFISNIKDGQSVLDNQGGNSYHATNLFDNDPRTGWSITLSKAQSEGDYIYGPTMSLNAEKVRKIRIVNGYAKDADTFNKNTRAKWIEIYRITTNPEPKREDILYSGLLEDTMAPQELAVNPDYDNSNPTLMVQIRFKAFDNRSKADSYYMGSKWDDLTISELAFFGVSSIGEEEQARLESIRQDSIKDAETFARAVKALEDIPATSEIDKYLKDLGFTGNWRSGKRYEYEEQLEGDIEISVDQFDYILTVGNKTVKFEYFIEDTIWWGDSTEKVTIEGDNEALMDFYKSVKKNSDGEVTKKGNTVIIKCGWA